MPTSPSPHPSPYLPDPDSVRDNIAISIVTPTPDAPAEVRALFDTLHPGSVAVAFERYDTVVVYYEGGIYTRPADRQPTPTERDEYAKIAAGRARQYAPTIARFFLSSWTGLRVIGTVDANYRVTFDRSTATVFHLVAFPAPLGLLAPALVAAQFKRLYRKAAEIKSNGPAMLHPVEHAYFVTQNLESAWPMSRDVICLTGEPRSTSVGDVVEVNGTRYLCLSYGWAEVEAGEITQAQLDALNTHLAEYEWHITGGNGAKCPLCDAPLAMTAEGAVTCRLCETVFSRERHGV